MKGFKVYKNFITDKECQQIIDSLNKQESDHLQNRYEIQDYDIPQSVLDKSQDILGDEKVIATRVQCYETGQNFDPHRDAIWYSMPKHGTAKEVWKRDRNLSISILLNDEFEGGELIIEGVDCKLEKGDAVMFSAMCLHWVQGVWEGTRYAVAVWSGTWGFEQITKEKEQELSFNADEHFKELLNRRRVSANN